MAGWRALIEQAQSEHRVLRIVYRGAGRKGTKERHIEVYEFDGTYIDAYCRHAREKRSFRLDRVLSLELLKDRFVPDLLAMDAIDQEGWANRSPLWRRRKAAEIGAPTSAPVVIQPVQPTRTQSDSSGCMATLMAGILLATVGLTALLSGGSSPTPKLPTIRSSSGVSSWERGR